MSVIANDFAVIAYYLMTHLQEQVKMRFISQLIKGISRVFQNLLKHFSGTIISTSFVSQSAVLPVIFCLNLNKSLLSAAEILVIVSALVKTGLSL